MGCWGRGVVGRGRRMGQSHPKPLHRDGGVHGTSLRDGLLRGRKAPRACATRLVKAGRLSTVGNRRSLKVIAGVRPRVVREPNAR